MTVEWSDYASDQLVAIRDSLVRSSLGYATVLAERVVRRTEALAANPFFGAEVPEYADESLREVYEHPYRILYRVHANRVEVVAVVHSARRLPPLPPS